MRFVGNVFARPDLGVVRIADDEDGSEALLRERVLHGDGVFLARGLPHALGLEVRAGAKEAGANGEQGGVAGEPDRVHGAPWAVRKFARP